MDDFSSEKNGGIMVNSDSMAVCLYLEGNAGTRSPRSPRSVVPFIDKIIHNMRMNEVS